MPDTGILKPLKSLQHLFSVLHSKPMTRLMYLLLFLPGFALGAEPSSTVKNEIDFLFSQLKNSNCTFNRNGSWYSASEAVQHLNKKYAYLRNKGLVSSTDDFIARAASQSSMSGKPYQMKCGVEAPLPSRVWLNAELLKYRTGKR